MKRQSVLGFFVTEACEDFEQVLALEFGPALPASGVLRWTDGPRTLFASQADARAAIVRTEHYRLAFNDNTHRPERKFCRVVPVVAAAKEIV